MGLMSPAQADSFLRDLGSAQQEVRQGVCTSQATAANRQWNQWHTFCNTYRLDPTLQEYQDPVPILQIYATRYRRGSVSPSKKPVRSRTVEDAIRSIGQTIATLGSSDPRYTSVGNLDFQLQRMYKCYSRQDPPPHRVKPIPVNLLKQLASIASNTTDILYHATVDMITLAFYFLLRPGEYTGTKSDTTPFCLNNVQFFIGNLRLNTQNTPLHVLRTATFVTLEFTTQKNGVRGEVVGLGRSGHPHFCPVQAALRRVIHLRRHHANATQPLASYYHAGRLQHVSPANITTTLKTHIMANGAAYNVLPTHVTARSLRASGAMALLCARIDANIIQLLGRWRSDQMLRYLHLQAEPLMSSFSSRMLNEGSYALLPGQDVPLR